MDFVELARVTVKTDWVDVLINPDGKNSLDNISEQFNKMQSPDSLEFVYPPMPSVFKAFTFFNIRDTRVVILGLDPYIGAGQATGLSFSVSGDTALPPSLQNIFKELAADVGVERGGDLTDWATQGVLLMNCYLTVRHGKTKSHAKIWNKWSDGVIRRLSESTSGLVFILWGADAQSKEPLIGPNHFILKSVHPSPLSAYRGFFGSKPFSKCNELLETMGHTPIRW